MHVYTATIGRNISTNHPDATRAGKPLTLTEWGQFVEDVTADMGSLARRWDYAGDDTLEVHYGKGEWDGVEEESAKITLLTDMPLGECAVDDLRRLLTENARHYGQDAIALTIGTSELC